VARNCLPTYVSMYVHRKGFFDNRFFLYVVNGAINEERSDPTQRVNNLHNTVS
jgi:hypothetical protein